MAISVVQAPAPFANATSGSFGSPVTSGNSVILVVYAFNTANSSAISSNTPAYGGSPVGGTAVKLYEVNAANGTGTAHTYTAAWLLPNLAGGHASVGITLAFGAVNASTGLIAYEVSGLGSTPYLDKSSTGNATASTAISSGASGATTANSEFVIGSWTANNGASGVPGSPWTSQDIAVNRVSVAGYQIQTVSGSSYTFSGTGGGGGGDFWCAGVATVIASSSHVTASLTVTPAFLAKPLPVPVGNPPGGPWVLAFNEEFDNPVGTQPNPATWANHLIEGDAWRVNDPVQIQWWPHNQSGRVVTNSVLSLTAYFESPYSPSSPGYDPFCTNPMINGTQGSCTSGMIQSKPGFAYTHGYVEAMIAMPGSPPGASAHTAWWGQSSDAGWPPEIDVAENSQEPTFNWWEQNGTDNPGNYPTGPDYQNFHAYGAARDASGVTYYFDGTAVGTVTTGPSSLPFHLILSMSVHSGGGTAGFPCSMEYDYVRVWTTAGVPAAPAITSISPVKGVPSAGSATVAFTSVPGATSYRVSACPVDAQADGLYQGGYSTHLEAAGTVSPIVITGLTNGARYTFTASALNAVDYSVESATVPPLYIASALPSMTI